MTQKIRIAIIGAGRIGYVHAGSVNDIPELELVYVVDPYEENAKKVTAAFGGKVSNDPSAVIASGEIDAVIIGSPTATHIPLLRECIANGVHALCEKPLDLDINNVEAFRAEANAAKINITLGFNRRQDPQYLALKAKVVEGTIGTIEQVILTSRDPGPARPRQLGRNRRLPPPCQCARGPRRRRHDRLARRAALVERPRRHGRQLA